LCSIIGALILYRFLLSIVAGRPFEQRNAVRIAILALLIAIAVLARSVGSYLGAQLVLERLKISGPDSPVLANFSLDFSFLFLAAIMLVIAEGFRRGRNILQNADSASANPA
jgi:hypothetical protein